MTQYTPEQARHIAGFMERGAEMRNMGAPALRSLADQLEQALSHPKSNLADSGVIAAPVAGAHPDKGTSALAAPVVPAPVAVNFQQRVQPWMLACFGEVIAADREERNHRFLEEALELVQSTSCTAHEAHQLVDYVYGRPVGESAQEVGGVMVTLAALCLANGLDMHDAAEVELARIWTKVEAIRAKQAAKPKHSPLPQAAPVAQLSELPEGWVLLPTTPTEEMFAAFCNSASSTRWEDVPDDQKDGVREGMTPAYAAMLAAAPLPPKDAS